MSEGDEKEAGAKEEEPTSLSERYEPVKGEFVDRIETAISKEKVAFVLGQSTVGGPAFVDKIVTDPKILKRGLLPAIEDSIEIYEEKFGDIEVSEGDVIEEEE